MNLIFNAEALRPPITGIGNYSFHLLEQLQQLSLVDDIHCFNGSGWVSGVDQLAATRQHKQSGGQLAGGPGRRFIEKLRKGVGRIPGTKAVYDGIMGRRFQRFANAVPDAIYHETNYVMKPFAGPCITTVHDLSHIHYPQFHAAHVLDWLNRGLPPSLERADLVITVSEVIRGEIIEYFGIAEQRVRTIYEGVDANYRPRDSQQTSQVLERYGLGHGAYVLLVATLEPRKGIDVLLDAWALLPPSLREAFPLVLVGSSGWRNADLNRRIRALVAEGTVHHPGFVPSADLPALFSGAAVFTYPSVYEGFGLPVLDAMSSGVPVICRAGTSMAEFAQGACLLCESGDADELASRLRNLLEDTALRRDWSRRGLLRSQAFSWERCARETAALYRELA